jgi:hypothetical protein
MRKIGFRNLVRIVVAFSIISAVASEARTFTTLFNFDGTHGQDSAGSLVQGADGNFYGTTANGRASSEYCPFKTCGTVFKMTPDGKVTVVYSFCRQANCADGDSPSGALVQGTNGSFYGAAAFGGTSSYCQDEFQSGDGCGTIFEITPTGKLRTLYNFCALKKCADGALPNGSLVLGANGNFYGTAEVGGKHCLEKQSYGSIPLPEWLLQWGWPRRRDQHASGRNVGSTMAVFPHRTAASMRFRDDLNK